MIRKASLIFLVTCFVCDLALAQGRLAIVGGTVVNVRNGALVSGAVVLIEGDRITSVATGGQVPAGATVVDAKGKYILPGLIDLHMHYRDWSAELYLNHGVTTIVDLGGGGDWIQAQKQALEAGTILGPRLFISAGMDGEPEARDVLMKSLVIERVYIDQIASRDDEAPSTTRKAITNPMEAREAMKDYVSGKVKVDAIKTRHNLDGESLRAIFQEAQKINIPLAGHFGDARLAADTGSVGLEHTWPVAVSSIDLQARERALPKVTKGFIPPAEAFLDSKKLSDTIQHMVRRGVYLNPTMRMTWAGSSALLEKGFHQEEVDLLFGDWRLRYIPLEWKLANLKEFYEIDLWNRRDLTQYDRDVFEQGYKNAQRLIKAFVDAGGKLYAGTDCASFCVPGLGTHQELELLVDTGITPLQALQSATIWSAELMRIQDSLGTVEQGKAADLVILDANPLEDIRNTRKITKVISRGRMLDGEYHADFRNPNPNPGRDGSSHYFPTPKIRQATLQGDVLTVQGAGFIPYSFVVLNGQKLKTEFLDEFQLKAVVPSELLKRGTSSVTVENPNFGTVMVRSTTDPSRSGNLDYVSNAFSLGTGTQ